MRIRVLAVLLALVAVAAACGDDDSGDTADEAPDTTAAETDDTADDSDGADAPVTGPATITAVDQSGDGTTVTVDSVDLPTDGYVVVHADADGAPGAIIGVSELLPAGESTDVEVTLDEPLEADATVHPMGHVDANGNGEYEFRPPEETIDVPATTEDGDVAVVAIAYTVS